MTGNGSAWPASAWCPVCGQGPWVSVATHLWRKHPHRKQHAPGGPDCPDGTADLGRARDLCGCRPCGSIAPGEQGASSR